MSANRNFETPRAPSQIQLAVAQYLPIRARRCAPDRAICATCESRHLVIATKRSASLGTSRLDQYPSRVISLGEPSDTDPPKGRPLLASKVSKVSHQKQRCVGAVDAGFAARFGPSSVGGRPGSLWERTTQATRAAFPRPTP